MIDAVFSSGNSLHGLKWDYLYLRHCLSRVIVTGIWLSDKCSCLFICNISLDTTSIQQHHAITPETYPNGWMNVLQSQLVSLISDVIWYQSHQAHLEWHVKLFDPLTHFHQIIANCKRLFSGRGSRCSQTASLLVSLMPRPIAGVKMAKRSAKLY